MNPFTSPTAKNYLLNTNVAVHNYASVYACEVMYTVVCVCIPAVTAIALLCR